MEKKCLCVWIIINILLPNYIIFGYACAEWIFHFSWLYKYFACNINILDLTVNFSTNQNAETWKITLYREFIHNRRNNFGYPPSISLPLLYEVTLFIYINLTKQNKTSAQILNVLCLIIYPFLYFSHWIPKHNP